MSSKHLKISHLKIWLQIFHPIHQICCFLDILHLWKWGCHFSRCSGNNNKRFLLNTLFFSFHNTSLLPNLPLGLPLKSRESNRFSPLFLLPHTDLNRSHLYLEYYNDFIFSIFFLTILSSSQCTKLIILSISQIVSSQNSQQIHHSFTVKVKVFLMTNNLLHNLSSYHNSSFPITVSQSKSDWVHHTGSIIPGIIYAYSYPKALCTCSFPLQIAIWWLNPSTPFKPLLKCPPKQDVLTTVFNTNPSPLP